MEKAKKMVLIPESEENDFIEQEGSGPQSESEPKYSVHTKIINLIKIIYKLSKIDGFNEEGKIRGKNGFIEKSDLSALLNHCMLKSRKLYGEKEFIDLLKEAKIDESLVFNENIKYFLKNNEPNFNNTYNAPPNVIIQNKEDVTEIPKQPEIVDTPIVVSVNKRKRSQENDEDIVEVDDPLPAKKRKKDDENDKIVKPLKLKRKIDWQVVESDDE